MNNAIRTLVPALVGGLAQNVQSDDIDSSELESAVAKQGASGLLDGGVNVDQVDEKQGDQYRRAASSAATTATPSPPRWRGTGAGSGDLIKKLLPILAPIVLAYIGKQLTKGSAPARSSRRRRQSGGGGLGDILGSILGGAGGGGGGNNPLGSILGSVIGGGSRATRSARSWAGCSAARSNAPAEPARAPTSASRRALTSAGALTS